MISETDTESEFNEIERRALRAFGGPGERGWRPVVASVVAASCAWVTTQTRT
jgi:hypothetical protein